MKQCMQAIVLAAIVFFSSARADEPTGFRADMLGQIEYVQKQIMDLQGAIPESQMSWRPAKGVRSISEVYMHIVYANYLLPKFAGIKLPSDATLPPMEELEKAEAAVKGKKEIAEKLEKSFAFLKGAIKDMSDADLEKPVTFFGQQMTLRGILLSAFAHHHEHLGQSVAYARMNGIVPPWTAAQQAAAKSK